MPRFVILEHDFPAIHWDFMLEGAEVLRTWRLDNPPVPGSSIRAQASFDHRLAYLDYEGPISGDRGHVRRWDDGTFEYESESSQKLVLCLSGSRLSGFVTLTRVSDGNWSFAHTI